MTKIEPIYIQEFEATDNDKIVDYLVDLAAKINEIIDYLDEQAEHSSESEGTEKV